MCNRFKLEAAFEVQVLRSKLQARRVTSMNHSSTMGPLATTSESLLDPSLQRTAQSWKDWMEITPYSPLQGVTPQHSYLLQLAALSANADSFKAPGFHVNAADFPANTKGMLQAHALSTDTGSTTGWFRHANGGPDMVYYYVNHDQQWAAIVFSGTTNDGNVMSNLSIRLTDAQRLPWCANVPKARWHSGLAYEWTRLVTDKKVQWFLNQLDEWKQKEYKVWATGHSLGAMLATVCAYCRRYNLASFGGAVVGTDARGGPINVAGQNKPSGVSETWRFVHEYQGWLDFVSWVGYAAGPLARFTSFERIWHPTMKGALGGVYKINIEGAVKIQEPDAYLFPGLNDQRYAWKGSFIAHLLTGYIHSMNTFVKMAGNVGAWVGP